VLPLGEIFQGVVGGADDGFGTAEEETAVPEQLVAFSGDACLRQGNADELPIG
jgi:hypothetical protein